MMMIMLVVLLMTRRTAKNNNIHPANRRHKVRLAHSMAHVSVCVCVIVASMARSAEVHDRTSSEQNKQVEHQVHLFMILNGIV